MKRRTIAVLLLLALGPVAAELVYRAMAPAPLRPPTILTDDGRDLPLTEIAHFLRVAGDAAEANPLPMGRLPPGLVMRHKYDRPTWDYFDADGCVPVVINALGFRDDEFTPEKAPGELRILALGDSFTFGSGVRAEDSWPQVLERRLQARRGGPVQVVNAGFAAGASSPDGYVDWLASDGLGLDPDLVILGFSLNDMGPVPMVAYPVVDPEPWLGGVSRLLATLQRTLAQERAKGHGADGRAIVESDGEPWRRTQDGMRRLRDLLRERGVPLLVAVFPMMSLLDERYPYAGLHAMAADFCAGEDLPTVDLLASFRGRDERELWVHPTDQHPNAIGHRLIADGIFTHLTERGFPER